MIDFNEIRKKNNIQTSENSIQAINTSIPQNNTINFNVIRAKNGISTIHSNNISHDNLVAKQQSAIAKQQMPTYMNSSSINKHPTFKTIEEAEEYAKNNNIKIAPLTNEQKNVTDKQKLTNNILNNQDPISQIKYLSDRDKTDYLQDYYDIKAGFTRSRYTNKEYDMNYETLTPEEYWKDLEKTRGQQSFETWVNSGVRKVFDPVATGVISIGEGAGGGGIAKGVMNKIESFVNEDMANKNSRMEYLKGEIPESEVLNRRNELLERYKNDSPTTYAESIEGVYDELGNHQVIRTAGNITGNIGSGIVLTSAGIPAPLAYGTTAALNEYGRTDKESSVKDIIVEGAKGALFGIILKGVQAGTLGKTASQIAPKTIAEYGKYFAKSALSYAVAGGSTQALDIFKDDPNFDYVDWDKVKREIQEGKYNSVDDYLESDEYIKDVISSRASQIILGSIIYGGVNIAGVYFRGKGNLKAQKYNPKEDLKKLGLNKNATQEDIKKAYRSLAKQYHPDINKGYEEEFRKVAEAYQNLVNNGYGKANIPKTNVQTNTSQSSNTNVPILKNNTQMSPNINNVNSVVKALPTNNTIGEVSKDDLLKMSQNFEHKGKTYIDDRFTKGNKNTSNIVEYKEATLNNNNVNVLRKFANMFAKNKYSNAVVKNTDTGIDTIVGNKGIRETISKDFNKLKADTLDETLLKSIEEAVYKESSIDIDEKNNIYHYLVSLVQSGNKEKALNYITLKETPNRTKFYYNTLQKIEDSNLPSRPGENAGVVVSANKESSINNIIQSDENYVNKEEKTLKDTIMPTNEQLKSVKTEEEKAIEESFNKLNLKTPELKEISKTDNYKTDLESANKLIENKIKEIETGNKERDVSATPITKKEIIKTVEKGLGRPIREKQYKGKNKAYGIYKPDIKSIHLRQMSNFETAIHELGHHIDNQKFKMDLEKRGLADAVKVNRELLKLCEMAFGNAYDEDINSKLKEGFAEATKRYVIEPEEMAKNFPASTEIILNELSNDKQLNDVFNTLQKQVHNYINMTPQERLHSNMSINEDSDKEPTTIKKIVDRAIYEIYDDGYYLKNAVSKLAKDAGTSINKLNPTENTYTLFRLAGGTSDQVKSMLKNGIIDTKAGRKITKGYAEILENLKVSKKVEKLSGITTQKRINDLRDLLIAQRNLDYVKRGFQSGIREKDSLKVIEQFKDDKILNQVANDIRKVNDDILKYAQNNDMLTKKQIKQIKKLNENYIPMNRVINSDGSIIQPSTKGSKVGKVIQKVRGSDKEIIDPLESLISNNARIIRQIENNKIMKSLMDLAHKGNNYVDLFEEVPEPMTLKASVSLEKFKTQLEAKGIKTDELDLNEVYNVFSPKISDDKNMIMSYLVNGKRKYIQFYDKMLYNTLNGMNAQQMNTLEKVLNAFNNPLRYGATMMNVEFAIPNFISDSQQAFLYSDANFIPVVDSIIGMLDVLAGKDESTAKFLKKILPSYTKRKQELYQRYMQSGASQSGRMSNYRKEIRNKATDIYDVKQSELFGEEKGLKKFHPLANLINIMTYLPELSEMGTRFRNFEKEYNKYKKDKILEDDALVKAGINARDITQDFSRMGKATRIVNRVIPFSGAKMGSMYRWIEEFKKNPKRLLMRTGILLTATIAIKELANQTKNRHIEEMKTQKKLDNFIIPYNNSDEPLTIKKIQGPTRHLINLTEYIYDLVNGNIEEGKEGEKLGEILKDALFDNLPADSANSAVPQAIKPILENELNFDFYYGTDLIDKNQLKLEPKDQYDEYTSEVSKMIGKVFNISPIKLDNLIEGYFAGVGTQALNVGDAIINASKGFETPDKQLSEAFMTKRFFASGMKSSTSINEIYENFDKLETEKAYDRMTDKQKQEYKDLSQAKKTLSKINQKIINIRDSRELNGKEKKEQIEELQELRTDTARYYLGKELIDKTNKEKIELYEFYPSSSTYKYQVNANKKIDVTFTENDMQEYSKICRDKYKELEKQTKESVKYKEGTDDEKEDLLTSALTKARNYAKTEISEMVYKRDYKK